MILKGGGVAEVSGTRRCGHLCVCRCRDVTAHRKQTRQSVWVRSTATQTQTSPSIKSRKGPAGCVCPSVGCFVESCCPHVTHCVKYQHSFLLRWDSGGAFYCETGRKSCNRKPGQRSHGVCLLWSELCQRYLLDCFQSCLNLQTTVNENWFH